MTLRDKITLRKGEPAPTPVERVLRSVPVHTPTPDDLCVAFVKGILANGEAVRKNAVAREAENANLSGDRVNAAFHALNGHEYFDRGEWMWKLT